MAKTLKFIIFFLLIILISTIVSAATGICILDQEIYTLGETGTLSCSCTINQEQNREGFIVWKNSNGDILQSTASNSGPCKTSFFGDSYTFTELTNFTGNVTFSLNADGTGTPSSWGGVDDINYDNFNYTIEDPFECIITEIFTPTHIDLGKEEIKYFKVIDGKTGNPLIGSVCRAVVFEASGSPLIVEPYGKDISNYRTGSGGHLGLKANFDHHAFELDTTYQYKLECGCVNTSEFLCLDAVTGENVGFKRCEVTALFTTTDDFRGQDSIDSLAVVLSLLGIMIMFGIIGYKNEEFSLSFVSYSLVAIEMMIMLGYIYGAYAGRNLDLLMKINFFSMLIIGFGVAMISFLFHSARASGLSEEKDNKWQDKEWDKKW